MADRSVYKNGWQLAYCLLLIVLLVADALALTLTGQACPLGLRLAFNIASVFGVGLCIIAYTFYAETLIREITGSKSRAFRILEIVELVWLAAYTFEVVSRQMITVANGLVVIDYAFPLYIDIAEAVILIAVPVIAIAYRRRIGTQLTVLFGIFALGPILATVLFSLTAIDLSYALPALTFLLMDEFIQRDQAQRKVSEQAATQTLATQQRYLKSFGDMVNAALWRIFIDGRNRVTGVDWSDEVRHMLGLTAEEYPNTLEAWLERLHPDDRKRTQEAFEQGLDTKDTENYVYDLEYRLRRKDGEYCWYHSVGRMEYNDDGTRTLYGIIYDMTADKQLEEQQERLRAANVRLDAADKRNDLLHQFVKASIWSYDIDAEDEVVAAYYNSYVEETTSVAANSDPMEWIEALHPDDRERVHGEFMAAIRDHSCNTPYETTYRILGKDGSYLWAKTSGRLDRNEDGTAELFGISIDITEQMKFEREQQEKLQEALNIAESANQSKTEFLFNMSHDIRTPMNAIQGFTGMAVKHIEDREKVLDCLGKTQQASSMLLSLINSVLEVSRIESGKANLEQQPGDVFYSFVNIEGTMHELAEAKDIDLAFEFGDVRDRYVYADFSRCVRVFVNVVSNAIKYTPEGGRVRVRCEQIGEASEGIATFRYTIADNGIGMSEEFQKHVFDQFAREETATVSGIQGTGLGLAVCKSFVELMGGTISVQSTQGVGTTFTIVLPFGLQEGETYTDPVTGAVVTESSKADVASRVDFRGRRVLLVEDNELNREIALDILEEEGLEVEEAEDGSVAVELLREKGPRYYDFILMDIQMPKMDGYEATRAIREMYPGAALPVIALSANAFAEDKEKSREAGMDDHVAKPININELFAALARFL